MPRRTFLGWSLVLVLLGTTSTAAYAAGLAAGSVRTKHLATGAVTAKKVKDGKLTPADLAAGTPLPGPAGAPGAAGPKGPTGPVGSARGAANINYDGTVYQATGTLAGITVHHAGVGVYCIAGAVRGPDDVWWGTSSDGAKGFVVVDDHFGWADCPQTSVRVTAFLPNGTPADWDLALAML